jgi:hypothetical protein
MRVLLLETLNEDQQRHHRAEIFPFLLGLARELGWEPRWWVVPVPRALMHSGGRFVVQPPDDIVARLQAELAAFAPDLVVVHARPAARFAAALRAAAPQARLADLTCLDVHPPDGGDRSGRVGAGVSLDVPVPALIAALAPAEARRGRARDGLLLDRVLPVFERRFLGFAADPPPEPIVRLAMLDRCTHRPPLRNHPDFRHLTDDLVRRHHGCSFCPAAAATAIRLETPLPELLLRQIRAHQRAAPATGQRLEYFLEKSPVASDLAALLDALPEAAPRPCTVTTMLRADALLAQRARLEGTLARLRAAGHRLFVVSVGAENFSAAENQRFNKGLPPERLWECVDLVDDLEARFPDVFRVEPGRFSTILFTPWTRPEDLRANIRAARRLGRLFLQTALGTRLQLWDELPITELARADGLLTERFGSLADAIPVCVTDPDTHERPWRFADPRSERLHALLIRLDPSPLRVTLAEDDPLREELRRARQTLPPATRDDYVAVAEALVDAVEALGAEAGLPSLLAHAATILRPSGHGAWTDRTGDAPLRVLGAGTWPVGIVRRIEQHRPALLEGYRLGTAEIFADGPVRLCRLWFDDGTRAFELLLRDRRPGDTGWQVGERFVATYRGELPHDPQREQRLARLLLRAFDRAAPGDGIEALAPE